MSKAKVALDHRRAEIVHGCNEKLTVAKLDARVALDEQYQELARKLLLAEKELTNEKARRAAQTTLIEMWRTEQSNARELGKAFR